MTNRCGFTLIELLVVVLIIGILAGVAVPQYQKAVEKSRAAEAITLLKSIETAEQVYYLANNKYVSDIFALDLQFPNSHNASIHGRSETDNFEIQLTPVHYWDGMDGISIEAMRKSDNPYYRLSLELRNGTVISRTCEAGRDMGVCSSISNGVQCDGYSGQEWCVYVPGGPV